MIDFEKIKVTKPGFGFQMIRRESLKIYENYGWSLELEPPETPKEVASAGITTAKMTADSVTLTGSLAFETPSKRTRKSNKK